MSSGAAANSRASASASGKIARISNTLEIMEKN